MPNRATIEWTTSEPTKGRVEYGPTASYGSATPTETVLSTSHSVTLTGLNPETTYQYRLSSADDLGNRATTRRRFFHDDHPEHVHADVHSGRRRNDLRHHPAVRGRVRPIGDPRHGRARHGLSLRELVDGVPTATRTDTNVTADKTVTATFAINTYTLNYAAGPGGTLLGPRHRR